MSSCKIIERNTFLTLKKDEAPLRIPLRRTQTSPSLACESTVGSDASPCSSYRSDIEFTTLMIKNLPCKYMQEWLLADIRAVSDGCDFLQLPMTRRGDLCMGYAFANFKTPELAAEFLLKFQGSVWGHRPNSSKRAEVSVAHEQGFVTNVQKFVFSARKNTSRSQPFIDTSSF